LPPIPRCDSPSTIIRPDRLKPSWQGQLRLRENLCSLQLPARAFPATDTKAATTLGPIPPIGQLFVALRRSVNRRRRESPQRPLPWRPRSGLNSHGFSRSRECRVIPPDHRRCTVGESSHPHGLEPAQIPRHNAISERRRHNAIPGDSLSPEVCRCVTVHTCWCCRRRRRKR
jgi:hypothetical protein